MNTDSRKSAFPWTALLLALGFLAGSGLLGWVMVQLGAICGNPIAMDMLTHMNSLPVTLRVLMYIPGGVLYLILPMAGVAIGGGGGGISQRSALKLFGITHLLLATFWLICGTFLTLPK